MEAEDARHRPATCEAWIGIHSYVALCTAVLHMIVSCHDEDVCALDGQLPSAVNHCMEACCKTLAWEEPAKRSSILKE